jgi:hypothetical protein
MPGVAGSAEGIAASPVTWRAYAPLQPQTEVVVLHRQALQDDAIFGGSSRARRSMHHAIREVQGAPLTTNWQV